MPPLGIGVAALHEHLSLTAERPVETAASRWLGEAEAIVADLVHDPALETEVLHERLIRVSELLAEVEETHDPIADHHVELARDLTAHILSYLGTTH